MEIYQDNTIYIYVYVYLFEGMRPRHTIESILGHIIGLIGTGTHWRANTGTHWRTNTKTHYKTNTGTH